MMSKTAPTSQTHNQEGDMGVEIRDGAFVSVFNEGDYSAYLYTQPAFASGFLPLESVEKPTQTSHPMTVHKSKVRPTETANTGTTPPPTTSPVEKKTLKTAVKTKATVEESANATERRERRPSFIQVSPVDVHHEHDHTRRRHSSASHVPMSWWPVDENLEQHRWVENGETLADEEEEVLEEEIWQDAFYE